jgi:hypothetical protein
MDGDVPMRHGWQSIGLGAVGFDAMATPTFGHPCPAQSSRFYALYFWIAASLRSSQ